MPHHESICIFEDKKFSNFFPISLSKPVFEMKIGLHTLRLRLAEELPHSSQSVICREYLAPHMMTRDASVQVNKGPDKETLFVNGRLLCYGEELEKILQQIPNNGIGVKGGYVVAARLAGAVAADFAGYIKKRISENAIGRLCEEIKGYVSDMKVTVPKEKPKKNLSSKPKEAPFEDAHEIGQDNVIEKLPNELIEIIQKRKITVIEIQQARLLSFLWQIIEENQNAICDDFNKLPFRGQAEESIIYSGVQMVGEENISIGEATVIKPGVVLDASAGPIAIGDGTLVMPNASLIGPVAVGKQSVIKTGAKILEGTSIGDVCKVGGEVEESIISDYSNKQHDGFIGHSYLGEWVNIGAGCNTSDLKNNYSPIRMWCAGMERQTGRQFLGMVVGDHSKTGISTMFNTGTVMGFNCNVYGSELPAKFIPSFSWGRGESMGVYDLKKAMETASIVMERRSIKFDSGFRTIFEKIFELSQLCAKNI